MAVFDEKFDALVDQKLKEYHVPGISIVVVQGEEVFSKGYGFARLPATLATESTQYYVGSITKGFFAATWCKWLRSPSNIDRPQKLSLESKLADLIRDDFVLQDPWATTHITIEDTLCHRTGLSRHERSYGGSLNSVEAVTRNLRNVPMSNEPRYKFEYCNMGYMAATHAMETVTGKPPAETMKDLIFDPVGMNDTYCSREEALRNRHGDVELFDGYTWLESGFKEEEHLDFGPVGGAGFMISNVLDMAKYLKAMLRDDGALSKEVKEDLLRPRITDEKEDHTDSYSLYALGYDRKFIKGVEVISHNGGLNGYTSLMAWIPSKNWGFVALGNSGSAVWVEEILFNHLLDNAQGVKLEDRFDFDKKFHGLSKKSTTKDPEAAKRLFPDAPSPALPPTLPLEKYAGTYHNAGYRSFTFELVQPEAKTEEKGDSSQDKPFLLAKAFDRTWKHLQQLYHVSGEYWVGYALSGEKEEKGQRVEDFHAAFRISPAGTVQALGLEIEKGLTGERWEDKLIWFDRVEEDKGEAAKPL